MKKILALLSIGLLVFSLVSVANAMLIDNLDGTITQIREDGTMLMWLQDFSLSRYSSLASSDGQLKWNDAMNWANQLNFSGYDDWRLPAAYNFDGSGPDYGFNITTNEWGNLYYVELGGTVGPPDGNSHLETNGPFINIHYVNHWSSTVYAPNPQNRWGFGFGTGIHADVGYYGTYNYATAVRDITPVPIPVNINIRPQGDANRINLRSNGKVAVAILSTPEFDAPSQVDQGSLTFGATGDEQSLISCKCKPKDADHDGVKDDLVCLFYVPLAGFQCGDTEGILKGKTVDGTSIKGADSVTIVPCK